MDDRELLAAFEGGTLDPAGFHHEQHLRVAFRVVREVPLPAALVRVERGLRSLAERAKKPGLYHATITWALVFLIHERALALPPDAAFEQFAAAHPELLTWAGAKAVLERRYRPGTLDSERARATFVLPDAVF